MSEFLKGLKVDDEVISRYRGYYNPEYTKCIVVRFTKTLIIVRYSGKDYKYNRKTGHIVGGGEYSSDYLISPDSDEYLKYLRLKSMLRKVENAMSLLENSSDIDASIEKLKKIVNFIEEV